MSPPSVVRKWERRPECWALRVKAVGSGYWRVIGDAQVMHEIARRLGLAWMKGIGLAVRLANVD